MYNESFYVQYRFCYGSVVSLRLVYPDGCFDECEINVLGDIPSQVDAFVRPAVARHGFTVSDQFVPELTKYFFEYFF